MDAFCPIPISVRRSGISVPLLPQRSEGVPGDLPSSKLLVEKHFIGNFELPEHEHIDFCLHLQIAGKARFEWWCDAQHGTETHVPGTIMLLPPGTRDRARWEGACDRFVVSLDRNFLKQFAENWGIRASESFQTRWNLRDFHLEFLLREIGEQSLSDWNLGGLYADSLSMALATALVSRHMVDPVQLPTVRHGLSLRALKTTFEYMTENMHHDLRLSDIAVNSGLSVFHFTRLFRGATGQSPHQFLVEQRIRRAKHLLRHSRFSVAEVGEEVGYRNPAHFSRAFRQREGCSPQAWRLSHR